LNRTEMLSNDHTPESAPKCAHCGEEMKKTAIPREANFDAPYFYVCFNDSCSYFIEGWEWMKQKYQVNSTYRYRIDPVTEQEAPFPVWSKDAMRDRIIE